MSKFRITDGKGFQLTFGNGWTVSVQFGPGNYCQNRDAPYMDAAKVGAAGSCNAEVAAWDDDGVWYDFGGDTVEGYMDADAVVDFIAMIKAKGEA